MSVKVSGCVLISACAVGNIPRENSTRDVIGINFNVFLFYVFVRLK
jgi:hypothetical protein